MDGMTPGREVYVAAAAAYADEFAILAVSGLVERLRSTVDVAYRAGREDAARDIEAAVVAGALIPEWARDGNVPPTAAALRAWAAQLARGEGGDCSCPEHDVTTLGEPRRTWLPSVNPDCSIHGRSSTGGQGAVVRDEVVIRGELDIATLVMALDRVTESGARSERSAAADLLGRLGAVMGSDARYRFRGSGLGRSEQSGQGNTP